MLKKSECKKLIKAAIYEGKKLTDKEKDELLDSFANGNSWYEKYIEKEELKDPVRVDLNDGGNVGVIYVEKKFEEAAKKADDLATEFYEYANADMAGWEYYDYIADCLNMSYYQDFNELEDFDEDEEDEDFDEDDEDED